ncbi:MAG: type II toxin-antitoxin system VapC family toxin [Candidatus Poribacteria bacterium]
MNRIIIDTNIYIDYFNSGKHAQIIYQEGYPQVIHVSSIVLMELMAGSFSRTEVAIVNNIVKVAKSANKIVTPIYTDYVEAGRILVKLQSEKGYDLKKAYSLTNDVLIALSARRIGATVVTQNRRDFEAI